jgi:hypothetical protein
MRYLLMICFDETGSAPPATEAETLAWVQKVDSQGIRQLGDRLRPVSDATTVRVREGEVLLADGPFAETKEQIGGFDLIECGDLDQALAIASEHPVAGYGSIEVRPLWEG